MSLKKIEKKSNLSKLKITEIRWPSIEIKKNRKKEKKKLN